MKGEFDMNRKIYIMISIVLLISMLIIPKAALASENSPTIEYQAHIQKIGWEKKWATNGATAGTTGQAKRMEAIKIRLKNSSELNVEYRAHVQKTGWENTWAKNGEVAGTTGQSKRMEAIQIKLSGKDASKYDIYYRSHIEKYGWLGWVKNGKTSGSTGIGYRMEAIQIKIVPKGSIEDSNKTGYVTMPVKETNILFIGNSKTYVYDVNLRFQNIAKAAGKNVHVERTPSYGGKTLYELSTFDSVRQQIKSRKWDYIVVQEQTETSEQNYQTINWGCQNLMNYARNNSNKNVTFVYNATWIVKTAGQNRQNTVNNNFNTIRNMYEGKVVYSGNAFINCRDQCGDINLYTDDRHPTLAGQYLNACCVYSTIFGKLPDGLKSTEPQLNNNTANRLQKIATKTMGL